MKRSTRWTTAIAATALLAVPVAARAQEPAPTAPSQPAQRPAAQTDTQQPASAGGEHLRQAQAALNDIPAASLTGTAKSRVAELKKHINNLEKSAGPSSNAQKASERASNLGKEVAAADRILSELLGAQGATGATEPTGTSGATATPSTTRSKSPTTITLDDAARAKLQEVRTHITAFAASMSNTPGAPGAEAAAAAATPSAAQPSATEPSASTLASAAANAPTPSTNAAPTAQPSSTTPQPAAQAQSPAQPTPTQPSEPAAAAAQNPQSAQTPSAGASTASSTASQQVDPDIVKRHLTAARNSLSELTQLPAAGQLSGDARAQVSQLITNFNELITTNTDWKASYAKVQANLSTLIGDQRTDESPAAPAAGAAGAVGTSGTTTLDPAIRSKLTEFRTHLMEFEKAASGGAAPSGARSESAPAATPSASAASAPSEPAAASAAGAASAASTPTAATPSTPSASTASASNPPSEPSPAASSAAASSPSASGRTSATAGAVGTSGSTAASPTSTDEPQSPSKSRPTASSSQRSGAANQGDAMRHIEAIEAILNGSSPSATGASKAAKPGTLDHAQIEEIKSHLAELRKAVNQDK